MPESTTLSLLLTRREKSNKAMNSEQDPNISLSDTDQNLSPLERRHTPMRRSSDRIIQQAQAFVASLEIIGDGVILLDHDARVVYASESAKKILLNLTDHISIQEDRLYLPNQTDAERLQNLLEGIKQHSKIA